MGLFHVLNTKPALNTEGAPFEKDLCRNLCNLCARKLWEDIFEERGYRSRVKGIHEVRITVANNKRYDQKQDTDIRGKLIFRLVCKIARSDH